MLNTAIPQQGRARETHSTEEEELKQPEPEDDEMPEGWVAMVGDGKNGYIYVIYQTQKMANLIIVKIWTWGISI